MVNPHGEIAAAMVRLKLLLFFCTKAPDRRSAEPLASAPLHLAFGLNGACHPAWK